MTEPTREQVERVAGVDAPTPEPAPAPAWPSESAVDAAYGQALKAADGEGISGITLRLLLQAAYAEDLPQIERAAEERGARELVRYLSGNLTPLRRRAIDEQPELVVKMWLSQRAEGTP